MESTLSCLLGVVYHELGDRIHRMAWVRQQVKAGRLLKFDFVPIAAGVYGTVMEPSTSGVRCL